MKRKDSQIVGLFTLIQRVLSPLEKGEKEEKFFLLWKLHKSSLEQGL